jgi:hypothetical protein
VRHVSSSTRNKLRLNKSTCWNKVIPYIYRHFPSFLFQF